MGRFDKENCGGRRGLDSFVRGGGMGVLAKYMLLMCWTEEGSKISERILDFQVLSFWLMRTEIIRQGREDREGFGLGKRWQSGNPRRRLNIQVMPI
jgi:hypothetical protein